MTGPPRRILPPERRIWLVAALLVTLIGLATYKAFPPRVPELAGKQAVPAEDPQPDLATLLAITADSRSMLSEADAARAANARLPLVAGGLQPAPPFKLPQEGDALAASRALQCLTYAMYFEAAFEGSGGRLAVAQVILNRVRHPAFPNSVCDVVFQRSSTGTCQFTFACDGAMLRPRLAEVWQQTESEAAAALHGRVFAPVGMATHYHADYVFPHWAPRLEKIAAIGTHVFYRWPRGWGLRRAFTAAYSGSEPDLAWLSPAGIAPEAEPGSQPTELAGTAADDAPVQRAGEGGFVDPSKGWMPRVALPSGLGQAGQDANMPNARPAAADPP